jgi:hypothetical protein
MNSGYFPGVVNPKVRPQTKSEEFQTPFFFGGSQIPNALSIRKGAFSGSGFSKGSMSKTHMGDMDFTTKRGNKVFHQDGKFIKMFGREPFKKNGIY